MKRTYITDISHFLDEYGDIIQDGGPAPKLAGFLCLIIDKTTSNFPSEELNTGIRCKRARCKGSILSSLSEKHEEIIWFCPDCQDSGTIHNWQGTKWDYLNDMKIPENKVKRNLVEEFAGIIGNNQYHTFIDLLRTIGKFSRSRHISIIIAAYLRLALDRIDHEFEPGGLLEALLICDETPESNIEEYRKLSLLIDAICAESGIRNHKVDSKGAPYSISESTLSIYSGWEDMQWE